MNWGNPVRIAVFASLATAGAGGIFAQTAAAPGTTAAVDAIEKTLLGAEGLLARGQYALARQEFDHFLQQYPADPRAPRAHYGRALCEYNLNNLAAAAADLKSVADQKQFPRRDEALALLGTLYLQQNQPDNAIATLDQLAKDFPKSPQLEAASVNRAQALYRLARYNDSLNAVRSLLKNFPQTAQRASALYVGALDQRALGDNAESERTLRSIVAAYPNSPFVNDAQLLVGETLVAQGKTDAAIQHYQQLAANVPESEKPAIQFGLASALMSASKYPQAEQTFDALNRAYPDSRYAPSAALQRAVAQLKAGRRDEARASLAAVANHYPAIAPSVAYWSARCDLLDGKFDQASQSLNRLVGSNAPELPEIEFDLAYCELRLGHDAAALQRLEAFRAKHPHSPHLPEALYYEASALYDTGDFAKALEFSAAVPANTTVSRESQLLKGESLLMLGKYSDADALFAPLEKTATSADEQLRLALRRGQCAYFSKDYAAAEQRLTPVAANPAAINDPVLHEAAFLLGDAQLQQGKNEQAAATLKTYLATAKSRRDEAGFKLAAAQEHLHQTDAALATLQTVITDNPASPWTQRAQYECAQLTFARNDTDLAAQSLQKLLAAKPAEELAAPALYLLARVEMRQAHPAAAADHLADLARLYPHNPLAEDAAFVRGIALKDAHQLQPAESQLAAYLQTYPHGKYLTEARHQRAVCLAGLHKPEEAIRILTDLAHGSARNDSILYDLAWAYRAHDDMPHAIDTYATLIKDFPTASQTTPARVELAQLLYAKTRYADALSLLTPALADSHADARLHAVATYWAACCDARLNDPAKAAAAFDAFAVANPKDPLTPDALSEAGAAYAQLNQFDRAAQRQKQVISQFPNTPAASLAAIRLGEAQNQSANYPAAEATFTDWLKSHLSDPLASRAEFGIGWSLENRAQYDAARQHYAKTIAADNGPTAARAQFQTGETYFAQQQYEQAAKELLKVDILYAAPEWAARALYEAGRAFEQLKQTDQAKQQYEACIAKYKNESVTALAKKRLDSLSTTNP